MSDNAFKTTQRLRFPLALGPASGAAVLVVVQGDRFGSRIELGDTPLVLGRGAHCGWRIEHPLVSRRHCMIWHRDGRWWLRDLGAMNGTYLNEQRIGQTELQIGDYVTVGDTILRLMRRDALEARYLATLDQLASLDELTGLPNRRRFRDQFAAAVDHARLHGTPLALALLDLDRFKQINDRHGHAAGDEVLRQAGAALTRRQADGAYVARLGGEEFALLLPGIGGAEALRVAESYRAALSLSI